jgi:chorismate synthase
VSDDLTVRSLSSHADYQACVELQRETWGRDFNDAVPGSILLVAQKLGGVAAGAFDRGGRLLGFVFGMTGVENGVIVHWSDMLAVRPEAQSLGLGRRLKEFQRQAVAGVGARVIYWTFDPLVARNAHLNFNVFGVRAVQYVRDMYGDATGSELHRGIGTDRLVVAWPVADADVARRKSETEAAQRSAKHRDAPVLGVPDVTAVSGRGDFLRIAVPSDIARLQSTNALQAGRWRAATRAAFESSLAGGYAIDGFTLNRENDRGFYLLSRTGAVSTTPSAVRRPPSANE